MSKQRKTTKKPDPVFTCHGMRMPIDREIMARTEVLTRKKRVLPNGYDEAIKTFEEKLHLLSETGVLTPEAWVGKGKLKAQGGLKAAAAVLLSFGVSNFPVPPEQEAAARALAVQTEVSPV